MQNRIRDHVRSNVVGYVALFFALTGGVAWATHPGGANTISSGDIINGEVKSADVGDGEVKNNDLGVDSVGSGKIADRQVKNADLSIGASSSNTIADGGIQGVDVKNDTLTGTQVDESTLTDLARGTGRIQRVDFRANAGPFGQTILDLGGLVLSAQCDSPAKDLRIFWGSTVDDASIGVSYSQFGDGTAHTDYSSNQDSGFISEGNLSMTDDDRTVGTLVYTRPDGGSVSVAFQAEDSEGSAGSDALGGTKDCIFTGTATHTP